MRKVLTSGLIALMLVLGLNSTAAAQRAGMPRNDCATFYARQQGNSYDVVLVEIVGVTQGVVGVRILGLPRKVVATLNGIPVKKLDSRQIVCGREAVGEYALYDLKPLKLDAGVFEVRADGLKASRSVSVK